MDCIRRSRGNPHDNKVQNNYMVEYTTMHHELANLRVPAFLQHDVCFLVPYLFAVVFAGARTRADAYSRGFCV